VKREELSREIGQSYDSTVNMNREEAEKAFEMESRRIGKIRIFEMSRGERGRTTQRGRIAQYFEGTGLESWESKNNRDKTVNLIKNT